MIILEFFELFFGILENPKLLLLIVPLCIGLYIYSVYF